MRASQSNGRKREREQDRYPFDAYEEEVAMDGTSVHYGRGQRGGRRGRYRETDGGRGHRGGGRGFDRSEHSAPLATREVFGNMGSSPVPTTLCKYWTLYGDCKKLPVCRFGHDLRSICRVPSAHKLGIYSMCSVTVEPTESECLSYELQPGMLLVDLYTASQDKTVKRWTLYPDTRTPSSTSITGDGGALSSCPKLQIRHVSTFDLEASCVSVFFGLGCLVCGLSNGDIKVYDRSSGHEMTLKEHKTEVHCVQLIDTVLISGDWSGKLVLWKADPVEKNFTIGASLDIGSPITCFIEVSSNDSSAADCLNRHLWVGCTGSIKIVDLLTLTLITTLPIEHTVPSRPAVVMSLLRYESYLLCCLLGGGVKVFDGTRAIEITTVDGKKKQFCSMAGSHSQEGPVVLCGGLEGEIYVLALPGLDARLQFRCHGKDLRAIHNIGGTPSFFATGAMDGSLSIWYWCKPPQ